MSNWQKIFIQSRVNGGPYRGDQLPQHKWEWPRGTWFQNRVCRVRLTGQEQRHEMPAVCES